MYELKIEWASAHGGIKESTENCGSVDKAKARVEELSLFFWRNDFDFYIEVEGVIRSQSDGYNNYVVTEL